MDFWCWTSRHNLQTLAWWIQLKFEGVIRVRHPIKRQPKTHMIQSTQRTNHNTKYWSKFPLRSSSWSSHNQISRVAARYLHHHGIHRKDLPSSDNLDQGLIVSYFQRINNWIKILLTMSNLIEDILIDHPFQHLTLLEVPSIVFLLSLSLAVGSLELDLLLQGWFLLLQRFLFLLTFDALEILGVGIVDIPLDHIGSELGAGWGDRLGFYWLNWGTI